MYSMCMGPSHHHNGNLAWRRPSAKMWCMRCLLRCNKSPLSLTWSLLSSDNIYNKTNLLAYKDKNQIPDLTHINRASSGFNPVSLGISRKGRSMKLRVLLPTPSLWGHFALALSFWWSSLFYYILLYIYYI
jgi:hypothetical protein